jgi:hypothetical protein
MLWLGFDPGGERAFGIALLQKDGASPAVTTVDCATDAVAWIKSKIGNLAPSAVGIDTLMYWSGNQGGWREADKWLRKQYPEAAGGVLAPNSLWGSMVMQGMALAMLIRQSWPEVPITETHPKMLYYACSKSGSRWNADRQSMLRWLSAKLGCACDAVITDHEFDAIMSAWAAREGFSGAWSRDLRKLPTSEAILEPAGAVHYWWPELTH